MVVSGGVTGTVGLLLRSRARGGLRHLSPRLGHHVRTNSESILAADGGARAPSLSDHVAITSGIQADAHTHIEMVRFNKGSDALFFLTAPLLASSARVAGLVRLIGGVLRHPLRFLRGLWPLGRAERTAIVLAMQSTDGHVALEYRRRWWRYRSRVRSALRC